MSELPFLKRLYDADHSELSYVDITITVSTLVSDLLNEASVKSNISVSTLVNSSILRVLHDVDIYIQSQNKAENEK